MFACSRKDWKYDLHEIVTCSIEALQSDNYMSDGK